MIVLSAYRKLGSHPFVAIDQYIPIILTQKSPAHMTSALQPHQNQTNLWRTPWAWFYVAHTHCNSITIKFEIHLKPLAPILVADRFKMQVVAIQSGPRIGGQGPRASRICRSKSSSLKRSTLISPLNNIWSIAEAR